MLSDHAFATGHTMGTVEPHLLRRRRRPIPTVPARLSCVIMRTWPNLKDGPDHAIPTSSQSWLRTSRRAPLKIGRSTTATRAETRTWSHLVGLGANEAEARDHAHARPNSVETSPDEPLLLRGRRMTTEIAVFNRLGIALASDSAVTITDGRHVKIFNTADKLFELSASHPIGLMINGSMDCLGVPWEVLVKLFRRDAGQIPRPTVAAWAEDFVKFAETHALTSGADDGGYIDHLIEREISIVQGQTVDRMVMFVFTSSDDHKIQRPKLDIRPLLKEIINARCAHLSSKPVADSLVTLSESDVKAAYGGRIRSRTIEKFAGQSLSEEELSHIEAMIVLACLRAEPSDFSAGVIVAGYGDSETYPAMYSIDVDGRIAGRLKCFGGTQVSLHTSSDRGRVISFAQTDVIERLLKGVDTRFLRKTADYIRDAATSVGNAIEERTRKKRVGKKEIEQRRKAVRDVAELVRREYVEKTSVELKEGFSRDFDSMVAMMPKQELRGGPGL